MATLPTLRAIQKWDEDALPGCRIRYFAGPAGKPFVTNRNAALRYFRGEERDDEVSGVMEDTFLYQKRREDGGFDYYAQRLSPRAQRLLAGLTFPVRPVARIHRKAK